MKNKIYAVGFPILTRRSAFNLYALRGSLRPFKFDPFWKQILRLIEMGHSKRWLLFRVVCNFRFVCRSQKIIFSLARISRTFLGRGKQKKMKELLSAWFVTASSRSSCDRRWNFNQPPLKKNSIGRSAGLIFVTISTWKKDLFVSKNAIGELFTRGIWPQNSTIFSGFFLSSSWEAIAKILRDVKMTVLIALSGFSISGRTLSHSLH